MQARKIRQSKKKCFVEQLARYREKHALSIKQLAELLGRPLSTVRHWVSGRRMPPVHELQAICARINVDFNRIFASAPIRNLFYDDYLLGYDSLQSRYLEVKAEDPLKSLAYVAVAGAMLFNDLNTLGLETKLEIGPDYAVVITTKSPDDSFSFLVQGQGLTGIGFLVINSANDSLIPWRLLVKSNLDQALGVLRLS